MALIGRRIGLGFRPEAVRRDPDGPIVSATSTRARGVDQLVTARRRRAHASPHTDDAGIVVSDDASSLIHVSMPARDVVDIWKPLRCRSTRASIHLFDLTTRDATADTRTVSTTCRASTHFVRSMKSRSASSTASSSGGGSYSASVLATIVRRPLLGPRLARVAPLLEAVVVGGRAVVERGLVVAQRVLRREEVLARSELVEAVERELVVVERHTLEPAVQGAAEVGVHHELLVAHHQPALQPARRVEHEVRAAQDRRHHRHRRLRHRLAVGDLRRVKAPAQRSGRPTRRASWPTTSEPIAGSGVPNVGEPDRSAIDDRKLP